MSAERQLPGPAPCSARRENRGDWRSALDVRPPTGPRTILTGRCGDPRAPALSGHPPPPPQVPAARLPPLTFCTARARDTPGCPTAWRAFLPSTGNFCRFTFTSNGLGLGLARPPCAPAGAPGPFQCAAAGLAFPMAYPPARGPTPPAARRASSRNACGHRGAAPSSSRENRAGEKYTLPASKPTRLQASDYNSQQATLARRTASCLRAALWER